jgi:hypothetical protein
VQLHWSDVHVTSSGRDNQANIARKACRAGGPTDPIGRRPRRISASIMTCLVALVFVSATGCRTAQPPPVVAAAAVPEGRLLVASVQLRLNALGYDAGPVDGLMGPRTARAIGGFQRDNGLAETGEIDEALYRRVGGETAVAEAAARVGEPLPVALQPPPPPVVSAATRQPTVSPRVPVDPPVEADAPVFAPSGPSGFEGQWAVSGSCGTTAATVITEDELRISGAACAIVNVSPVGASGNNWRVEASCPDRPDPAAFLLVRSDAGDGPRLWVTNLSDGGVSFLEWCAA